jgi:predicted HicB family RNase H-like nuclease
MKTYPMLSFRCDTQLHKTIQREAKRRKMNVSEFIKEAVTFHLDNLADQRKSFDQ